MHVFPPEGFATCWFPCLEFFLHCSPPSGLSSPTSPLLDRSSMICCSGDFRFLHTSCLLLHSSYWRQSPPDVILHPVAPGGQGFSILLPVLSLACGTMPCVQQALNMCLWNALTHPMFAWCSLCTKKQCLEWRDAKVNGMCVEHTKCSCL